jgi:hypothetical protein
MFKIHKSKKDPKILKKKSKNQKKIKKKYVGVHLCLSGKTQLNGFFKLKFQSRCPSQTLVITCSTGSRSFVTGMPRFWRSVTHRSNTSSWRKVRVNGPTVPADCLQKIVRITDRDSVCFGLLKKKTEEEVNNCLERIKAVFFNV